MNRAFPFAVRIAAGEAASGLLARLLGIELAVNFLEVLDSHHGLGFFGIFPRQVQKLKCHVTHVSSSLVLFRSLTCPGSIDTVRPMAWLGNQPFSRALIVLLTLPMSARPCSRGLTNAMTLPMSFTEAAPVSPTAASMISLTSSLLSAAGM